MSGRNISPLFWKTLAMVVVVLALELLFFRGVLTDPDQLIGDSFDSRFNNLVAEHWFQVFQGREPAPDLPIFYPVKGTLGYSDALLGFGLPYSLLRAFGLDMFQANKTVLILVHLLGSLGILLLLIRSLKVDWKMALVGLVLFSFSSAFLVKSGHTQLFFFSVLPYLGITAIGFWNRRKQWSWRRTSYGLGTAVLLILVLLTSFYVAFFIALFGTISLLVFLFLERTNLRVIGRDAVGFAKANALELLSYGLVLLFGALLFLYIYLPAFLEFGRRPWQDVVTMLPQLGDLVNAAPDSLLWGPMLKDLFPDLSTKPNAGELMVGWPLGTFVLVASVLWAVARRKPTQPGSDAEANTSKMLLVLTLGVLLTFLLMVRIEGFSLWWFVNKLVPGAGGIRAVSRFLFFLSFPIALIVVVHLDRRLRQWQNQRLATILALLLVAGLTVDNLHKTGVSSTWKRSDMIQLLHSASPPPPDVAVLYNSDTSEHWILQQLDGWMLADHYGLKTINGYSGQFPSLWQKLGLASSSPPPQVSAWVKMNKVQGAYFYDFPTDTWTKVGSQVDGSTRLGFVDETWTTGKASISGLRLPVAPDQELALQFEGWRRDLLSPTTQLRVSANGNLLKLARQEGNTLFFLLPGTKLITDLTFECKTFIPKESGINDDSRSLGVDLKSYRIVSKGN